MYLFFYHFLQTTNQSSWIFTVRQLAATGYWVTPSVPLGSCVMSLSLFSRKYMCLYLQINLLKY